MDKQIKQKAKRIFAAMLALTVMSGTLPYTPLSGVVGYVAITASAASDGYLTDFLPVSASGTATGYFTYSDHFYKIDWSGINTSETSSVLLELGNNYWLKCCGNDDTISSTSLYASALDTDYWKLSHITYLAPGQSSDGYTTFGDLVAGASYTSNPWVYKKACTVTCMAANTPTWNWSADGSRCTAEFTCSANSSLTATVNADVTTSGYTATASVTFNGTSYTDTKSLVTNYNINYVLNGGTNASGNPSTYADNVGVSSFAAPTREHYTFGGWYDNANFNGTPVTSIPAGSSGDRTLYAKWTINSYTVTWKNDNGATLKTEQVNYGATPVYSGATPVKPATAQYTYTFTGWLPAVSAVTSDTTYTAQFGSTVNKYNVTWKDADGTVLETDNNVSYGTTPVYNGATPAKPSDDKYSYSFKGWNPSVSSVTGDVTYTATYTKTPNSNHYSQDGDTYTIHDDTGWDIFCDCLQDNDAYNRFSGKTVELEKDITVSRMAGSSHHDFCGTFEGGGKTLTFAPTESVNGTAPFSYVSETTPTGGTEVSHPVIRNLNVVCNITTSETNASGLVGRMWGELTIANCTVSGTINTSAKYAAGFIGEQNGTANITNCRSSVEINSSVTGDGTHGGFIGRTMNNTSTCIEGCVFDGKIVSTGTGDNATTSCGGFVGWRDKNGSLTITDSLYAPTADNNAVADGATFVRNGSAGANCYYTRTLGTAQGKQAYTITAGDDVTLGLSGTPTEYDVSGITAYAGNSGILYGNTFYAGSGDTVALELEYTGTPEAGYIQNGYTASAGTLDGTTLTMPEDNVTINADFDVESYFNDGTLTLKGTVLRDNNNNIILLPKGVTKENVQQIKVDSSGATLPRDSSWLFQNFTNVTSIDLTGADTRNVTNMMYMFSACKNLTELDLSSFDTGSVTDMNHMFSDCRKLETLDLSSFDTGSVTDMNHMFSGCFKLKTLDLSSFDTSRVSDMNGMFFDCCFSLKTIYVSEQWRTDHVDNSNDMFENGILLTGGNGTDYDRTKTDKEYARIDKDGQPGYLTGVYTLTLPENMEIVTNASPNMKVGSRYLKGAALTVRYTGAVPPEHYRLVVKANGTELTDDENGVYTIIMPEGSVTVTADIVKYTPVVINYVDINGITTPTTVYKEIYSNGEYTLPGTPYLDGYTFNGWTVNGTAYTTPDAVKGAVYSLVKAGTPVEITVNYTQSTETHSVTLSGGVTFTLKNANGEEITDTTKCQVSEQLYAVADQGAENQKFSHWERIYANKPPVIVGYETTYAFRMPNEDMTLTAVYVDKDEVVNKVGTAYIESVTKTGENSISFVAISSVPDGATINRTGIVACKGTDLNDEHKAPTIDYARFKRYNDTTCQNYTTFKYTWTKGNITDPNDEWCVRAYLVYTDKDGKEQTIYGDMVSAKLNDFTAVTEKKGTAYIESVTMSDNNKLSFVAVLSVSDGATMQRGGIVACRGTDLNDEHKTPTIDYASFNKYHDTTGHNYTTFKYIWTKSNITDPNDEWCVRAYLVYTDNEGEHTIYGDMVKAKLSDFTA